MDYVVISNLSGPMQYARVGSWRLAISD
jgi:hypothetical protein